MGDIRAGLTDMWRSVLLFLPKALLFIAILALGWIVAKAARKLVSRALDRVGFERAVRRGGLGRALGRGNYDASDILVRLAYYGLLLVTLQLAFGVWGPNPVSDLISGVVSWLPKAFVAIVIVVVAAAIGSAVRDLIMGALGGLSYGRVLANAASWFIIGLGVIAALNQVGIATTVTNPVLIATLATVAGILIVGVGGGLVRPMSHRWDRWLDRAESEAQIIRDRARGYLAGRSDAGHEMTEPPLADQGSVGHPLADQEIVDQPLVEHPSPERRDQEHPRPVRFRTGHAPAAAPVGAEAAPIGSDVEATQLLTGAELTQPLPRVRADTTPTEMTPRIDAGTGVPAGAGGTPTGEPSYEPDAGVRARDASGDGGSTGTGTDGVEGDGRNDAGTDADGATGWGGATTGQSAFTPRPIDGAAGGSDRVREPADDAVSADDTQVINRRPGR